jgi:hypothetical protein
MEHELYSVCWNKWFYMDHESLQFDLENETTNYVTEEVLLIS